MRAIVLVGGEGTRLRPLTWRTPKQLVPVLNRPLLDHLLLHLRSHGIHDVTLALTRRSEAIHDAFGDGTRLGLAVDYAYEETPLGSGGAIASVARGWTETFVVCNGDLVTSLDLTAMLAHHRERHAVLSISLHEVEDPSSFGVVDIAPDRRIRRFVEKPLREEAPSHLVNSGTWIFEPELIAMMDPTTFHRVEDHLFPDLCAAGRPVFGFPHEGYWKDVGNPRALLEVNLELAAGAFPARLEAPLVDGVLTDSTATIEPGARIIGPAVIGPRSHVAAGATVERSVIWDGVLIGTNATVYDSILATGASVGAAATVERAVVAHEAVITAGGTVRDRSVEPGATVPETGEVHR